MGFKRVKGLAGQVFTPDFDEPAPRKYPCRDCAACQFCSDDRCNECRKRATSLGCPRCVKRAGRSKRNR